MSTIAGDQIKAYIERVENLEEEKRSLAEDIKEVLAEAKGNGFDTKIIMTIVKLRRLDEAKRKEAQEILDLYMNAIGMEV